MYMYMHYITGILSTCIILTRNIDMTCDEKYSIADVHKANQTILLVYHLH